MVSTLVIVAFVLCLVCAILGIVFRDLRYFGGILGVSLIILILIMVHRA